MINAQLFRVTCRYSLKRAAKVALVIGTLLIAINQGDLIASGAWPPLWKIMLTYLVPFSVSAYSTAALIIEQRRQSGSR